MNELQVRITAEISQLQSALKQAKKALKDFDESSSKPNSNAPLEKKVGLIQSLTDKLKKLRIAQAAAFDEKEVARFNIEIEEAQQNLTRLNALGRSVTANLGSVGGGFGKVATHGGNAVGVTQEFNRIIQDAPFGLIGVGNNLQQLASNFSVLKSQAGSTGKAVGMALTSIISPVNLGLLAISALTAGFTAYQMGAFDGIFATEDLGKAAEEASQKLEDYRNSLDAVTRATIEGRSQAESEIQNFGLLRSQAENANIPLKDRLDAVKDMKDQFPDYLKGLTDEQILTGNVGVAYENLTKQIIATAKARAFSDEIAKNSLEVLTLEERALERTNQIIEARRKLESAKGSSLSSASKVSGQFTSVDQSVVQAQNELNKLISEQITDVEQLGKINSDNLKLQENITNQISEGARFTKDVKNQSEKLKVTLSNIFDEKDLITQFEMIGKAVSQGLITPDQAALIKTNIAEALKNAENTAIQEAIHASLEDSFKKAISAFETVQVKDIPLDINFVPTEGLNDELGAIEKLQAKIQSITALRDVADPARIQAYNEQLKALQAQLAEYTSIQDPVTDGNKVMLDSFSALGIGIAASMDIGNKAFKGFITTVLSSAPKIISAIIAQAAAKKAADAQIISSNAQVAASEGIAVGAKAANALGPVGLALLPVFIGGALAIIGGAFSSIGKSGVGGGGGGGSMPSSAGSGMAPQLFTNAYAPTVPSSSSPTPSGQIDFNNAQSRMTVDIDGDRLKFIVDRATERQKAGG